MKQHNQKGQHMSEKKIDPAVQQAAALLGRKGGQVKSEAKARAVRENGKRGGAKLTPRSVLALSWPVADGEGEGKAKGTVEQVEVVRRTVARLGVEVEIRAARTGRVLSGDEYRALLVLARGGKK